MSTRNYDRSGRLLMEQFHVDPAGRDPLHDHYEGGLFGGFIGGGASGGDKQLSADPETIREELNEYVALDKPGHYSLYATSGRVIRRDGAKFENVTLRSNTLEFEVVDASPGWQAQTLATALAVLRDSASTYDEKRAAARTLRFLDSPDSVRELARQITAPGDDSRWEFVAGILGSRHRQEAVAALEAQLTAPDAAITQEFISALSETKFALDHQLLPPYPGDDPEPRKAWEARAQEIVKQYQQLQDDFYAQAARLAGSKSGTARAETVRTLLLRPADGTGMRPVPGLPDAEIASAFALLTPREQSTLLQVFWERMKTPGIARALETVLDQPDRGDEMLRAEALKRLYEVDPRVGRTYILAEIRRPQTHGQTFLAKSLTLLADETLPEFDEMLAARLEAKDRPAMGVDARVIGRYSTAAILPRVKAVYEKSAGQWACDIEDGLVSYFLRVDRDYGLERVRANAGNCMTESLKAVVAGGKWSAVEPAVIAKLNDTDAWAARGAAETLARYGSPKAEKALWQRVRAFHKQWADREADLTAATNMPRDANDAVALQFGLLASLGHAQAWLLDNDQIAELEGLALGTEKQNVQSWHWESPVAVNLIELFDGDVQGIIGPFVTNGVAQLQAKLAQFPRGTVFNLSVNGAPERLAPAVRAVHETVVVQ